MAKIEVKDLQHIQECICNSISGEFDNQDELIEAASVIFWRLISGDMSERQDIIDEYDLECCRVCEICGELITEGWLLGDTDVCSDECAAKFFDMPVEEFQRQRTEEYMVQEILDEKGDCRKYADLSKEEKQHYFDIAMNATDCYWTEWY